MYIYVIKYIYIYIVYVYSICIFVCACVFVSYFCPPLDRRKSRHDNERSNHIFSMKNHLRMGDLLAPWLLAQGCLKSCECQQPQQHPTTHHVMDKVCRSNRSVLAKFSGTLKPGMTWNIEHDIRGFGAWQLGLLLPGWRATSKISTIMYEAHPHSKCKAMLNSKSMSTPIIFFHQLIYFQFPICPLHSTPVTSLLCFGPNQVNHYSHSAPSEMLVQYKPHEY